MPVVAAGAGSSWLISHRLRDWALPCLRVRRRLHVKGGGVGTEIDRIASAVEALYSSGAISDETKDALEVVKDTLATGLGDRSAADELVLVVILVDDSTSVSLNMPEVRVGHQLMLDALRAESFAAEVQVQTRGLNHGVLSPYKSLASAAPLTEQNYASAHLVPATPLYLQSLLTLGSLIIKDQEEKERGVSVRTFSLLLSDGEDNASRAVTAAHVRALTTDMLNFASNHIVAGMGVGERVDYHAVFSSMGIPRNWIFTPAASANDLRNAFRRVAHSLALAAASEAQFAVQLTRGPDDSS